MLLSDFTWVLLLIFSFIQTQQYEEEKRTLNREIIVLNNHLMEAKITIKKLREDNVSFIIINYIFNSGN